MKKIWLVLNRTERQYAIALFCLFVLTAIVLIWFFIINTTKEVPARGGTLRIGLAGQPTSLNPLLAVEEAEKDMAHLLFSPLSEITETIEPTKIGGTWSVRLKENLIWHDGEPVTSDDIIFTGEQIQDPSTQSPLFSLWQGVQFERLSEREVVITPGPRSSPLLFEQNIERLFLIPKHIFSSIPPQNWPLSDYNLRPIGNGPYRFEKMVLKNDGFLENYTLSAFTQGSTEHPPYIQTILIRFFKSVDELEDAFRYGKIDSLGGIDPYEAKSIGRSAQTILYPTPSYYAVFINQSQNELLRSIGVRKALSRAVPRENLVSSILNGYGAPIVAPSVALVEKGSPQSQEILSTAGWTKNSEGKLERLLGGQSETAQPIILTVPELPFLENTARALKTSWESLGFTVTIKLVSPDTLTEEIVPRRDYQMLLFGNIPQPQEDLYPFWHSSQIFHPGLNLSLYKNLQLDGLLFKVRVTTSSVDRAPTLKEISQILEEETPAIFLYSPSYVHLATKQLRGVKPSESFLFPEDRFSDISEWHLRTKRAFK